MRAPIRTAICRLLASAWPTFSPRLQRAAELQVSTIPSPGRIEDEDGEPVPASHMNFLISNGRVILPIYEDEHSKRAQAELQAIMPDHEVIALPANHILTGGGSFHCMTQQVPETEGALP